MSLQRDKACYKCRCWRFSNPKNKCEVCESDLEEINDVRNRLWNNKLTYRRPQTLHFNGRSFISFV